MTMPTRPASSKAYGNEKWSYVASIANINTPLASEVTAGSSLDFTCYAFGSMGRPNQTTNRVKRERRICDTSQYEQIGDTDYEGGDVIYSFDPQGAAASTGVKVWEKFPAGTVGYFVRRMGLPVSTDFAVGQFVDVFPVEIGPGMPTTVGDGESAENAAVNTYAITSAPAFKKALG